MSAETAAPAPRVSMARGGPALRFGLGIVFALLIGHIIDMPLAFLAPVFAVGLLLPAPAPPDPRKLIAVPIVVGVVAVLVDAIGGFLAPMSDVLVLVFALVLFVCFHADALRGAGPVVGLVLTVTLIVGTLAANAEPIAGQIVQSMVLAALSASLATIIAYAIVPHTGGGAAAEPVENDAAPSPRPVMTAVARTVIALPIIIWFIGHDVVGSFFVLVVAINLLRLEMPERGALVMILSNVIGGIVALLCAVLMEANPSPLFAVLLFLGVAIVLGLELEKGGVRAALAQGATSTAIILLALAIAPIDETGKTMDRVVLVFATVVYVLLARALFERSSRLGQVPG